MCIRDSFDSGWMEETVRSVENKELKKSALTERLEGIRIFERQLAENGYLVVKLFLHISREEQKKRLEELEEDKNTDWRVTKNDWRQNEHYDKQVKRFDKYLEATSEPWAPWHVIDATNRKEAELSLIHISCPIRSEYRHHAAVPEFPRGLRRYGY